MTRGKFLLSLGALLTAPFLPRLPTPKCPTVRHDRLRITSKSGEEELMDWYRGDMVWMSNNEIYVGHGNNFRKCRTLAEAVGRARRCDAPI